MASEGPGAEVEVGRVEKRWPKSLHLPGDSFATSVVAEKDGVFIFEVQIKIPRSPTYLLCDFLEVTVPLCASRSSSIKWTDRQCFPPRSWREQ